MSIRGMLTRWPRRRSAAPTAAAPTSEAAWGFEEQAERYERGRPDYSPELDRLLAAELPIGPGTRVCDLGAGTGKFTRSLVGLGADVVAVEPVAAMRDRLAQVCPQARVCAGSAEDIPLPDASLDALVVAQAFHWFDSDAALAEIHRVLRPGGGLALVWNLRDTSVPWVRELGDTVRRYSAGKPDGHRQRRDWAAVVARHEGFTAMREEQFPHVVRHDVEALLARVASTSHVATLEPARRARCLRAVRRLVDRHPALAGSDTIDFPHRTVGYWCHRTG